MDNLHYRLIFDLGKPRQKKKEIPGKNLFTRSKIQKFGRETL